MEKEKKVNIWMVISIILIIVIIGVGGYFVLNQQLGKENDVDINDKNEEKDSLSVDDSIVQQLYEYVVAGNEFSCKGTYDNYYYANGYLDRKNVSDKVKFGTVVKLLEKELKYVGQEKNLYGDVLTTYSLDKSMVNNKIDSIFGKDNGYQQENLTQKGIGDINSSNEVFLSVTLNGRNVYLTSFFNENTDRYEFIEGIPGTCGGAFPYREVYTKLVDVKSDEDSLTLVEKAFTVTNTNSDDSTFGGQNPPFDIYQDFATTKLIGNLVPKDFDQDTYYEKGATITYTFKLDQNGDYYFDHSNVSYNQK